MPIHDWSRKPPGLFHHFHQQWAGSICNALNAGSLPQGFYALLDQRAAGVVPDVVTVGSHLGFEVELGGRFSFKKRVISSRR